MRALLVYLLTICLAMSLVQHFMRPAVRRPTRQDQLEQLMEKI